MLPRGKEMCEHAAGRLASQFEEVAEDREWFSGLPCSTLVEVLKSPSLVGQRPLCCGFRTCFGLKERLSFVSNHSSTSCKYSL